MAEAAEDMLLTFLRHALGPDQSIGPVSMRATGSFEEIPAFTGRCREMGSFGPGK